MKKDIVKGWRSCMNRRCRRHSTRAGAVGETIEKLQKHFGMSCRSGMSRSFSRISKKNNRIRMRSSRSGMSRRQRSGRRNMSRRRRSSVSRRRRSGMRRSFRRNNE
jgi:hypothetical protein